MSGFTGKSISGVSSVNGKSGAANLTANDVSAIPSYEKGIATGICELDGAGLVPLNRIPVLPNSYQGTWNANSNTPTITSGVGTHGDYYLIDTYGTTEVDGLSSWNIGDMIIFDFDQWDKIGRQDAVISVAGKIGAITLVAPDIGINSADDIPDGTTNIYVTPDEKDALAGTTSTPSDSNRFVTNSDSRLTDARIPGGLAGGGLTGSYPNPSIGTHSSKHLPSGTDPINTANVSTIGTSNNAGSANSLCKSDHIHAHGSQNEGNLHAVVTTGINGFMSSSDKNKLDGIPATGQKYAPSVTDPVSPAPTDGDLYFNTSIQMAMQYDASRSKWLSVEGTIISFANVIPVSSGNYYRCVDGITFSDTKGFIAFYNGTIIAIGYTRNETPSTIFEVTANGTGISSIVSTSLSGKVTNLNNNFSENDILAVRNGGGATTSNSIGWVRIKWRAT